MGIKMIYGSPAPLIGAGYAAGINKSRIRRQLQDEELFREQMRLQHSDYTRALDWQQRQNMQNGRLQLKNNRGLPALVLPEQQIGGPDPNKPLGAAGTPLTPQQRLSNAAAQRQGKPLPFPLYVPPQPLTLAEQKFRLAEQEAKRRAGVDEKRIGLDERRVGLAEQGAEWKQQEAEKKFGLDEQKFGATTEKTLEGEMRDLEQSIAPGGKFELPAGVREREAKIRGDIEQLDASDEWTDEQKAEMMKPLREKQRRLLRQRVPKAKMELTPQEKAAQGNTRYKQQTDTLNSLDKAFTGLAGQRMTYKTAVDSEGKDKYKPSQIDEFMNHYNQAAIPGIRRRIEQARRSMASNTNDDGTPWSQAQIDEVLSPYMQQLEQLTGGGPVPATAAPTTAPAPVAAPSAPAAGGAAPAPVAPTAAPAAPRRFVTLTPDGKVATREVDEAGNSRVIPSEKYYPPEEQEQSAPGASPPQEMQEYDRLNSMNSDEMSAEQKLRWTELRKKVSETVLSSAELQEYRGLDSLASDEMSAEKLQRWSELNEKMSDAINKAAPPVQQTTPATATGTADLPTFNSPEEVRAAGLRSGARFKTSDGRIKIVP